MKRIEETEKIGRGRGGNNSAASIPFFPPFLTPSPLAAPRTPFHETPRGYTSAAAAAAAPRAPAEKTQMLCYAVWLFLPFLRQTHHR